jgi:hypothetical protein
MSAFRRSSITIIHRSNNSEMKVHAELYDVPVIAHVFAFGVVIILFSELHIVVFGFDGDAVSYQVFQTSANDPSRMGASALRGSSLIEIEFTKSKSGGYKQQRTITLAKHHTGAGANSCQIIQINGRFFATRNRNSAIRIRIGNIRLEAQDRAFNLFVEADLAAGQKPLYWPAITNFSAFIFTAGI